MAGDEPSTQVLEVTEPVLPLLFRSLGASVVLHLLCAFLLLKTQIPNPGLQDSSPFVVSLLPPSAIPKFIDQPDAPEAKKPVQSKDISQVTSEARGPGKIPGPVTVPERGDMAKVPGPPATPKAQQRQEPSPSSSPSLSLREQISSLKGLGLPGEDRPFDVEQQGETGTDEKTVSLETQSSEFAPYLAEVKRRIIRLWRYPAYARNIGLTGELVLVFSISWDGNLTEVRVRESSGISILDEAAVDAVKAAAPYGRFPSNLTFRQLNIIANFEYVAKGASAREPE